MSNLIHGHAGHTGRDRSPTYISWLCMKNRCLKPDHIGFSKWGGRGIKICEQWMTFENFLADMGDRPKGKSLDRINNDGHYEPGNCRWATRSEQMHNRLRRNIGPLTQYGRFLSPMAKQRQTRARNV